MPQQVPIAEGLTTGSVTEPRLLGSRCVECGAYAFPAQDGCPRCSVMGMERVELSRTGTVWTWTSQEFLPPAPPYAGPETTETFERYYVGYVELDGELRVRRALSTSPTRHPASASAWRRCWSHSGPTKRGTRS